jgi:hypothetical protein
MINKTALRVITRMLSIVIEQTNEIAYDVTTEADRYESDQAVQYMKRAKQWLDQIYDRN